MEVMKIACQRKWQQIILENGFLEPKNSRNEKLWGWDYF